MKMNFDNYTIRPIRKEDAENYFLFIEVNRNRIANYFPKTIAATPDLASTKLVVANNVALWEKRELLSFIICDNVTHKIIGTVLLKDFNPRVQKCEIGFFVDKSYEGKGIITKAVSLVIKHGFEHFQLNKIFMRIAENNISSRRVAEKNGFLAEGLLRQDFKTSAGQLIDVVYYGLLRQ